MAADAAAIQALESMFPEADQMSPRSIRRFLASAGAAVWVAAADELLGALVMLTRKGSGVARIYSVIVAPAARGQGLAQALIGAAEAEARRRGLSAMHLEVREDNLAALKLYNKLGYRWHQRLPQYYADDVNGIRLRREL